MRTRLIQGNYRISNAILLWYKDAGYNKQVYSLVKRGFIPSTIKEIMEYRLKAYESENKNERKFWINGRFDTVDGLAFNNKNLVIVPHSEHLININLASTFSYGRRSGPSLLLKEEEFNELKRKYEVFEWRYIRDKLMYTSGWRRKFFNKRQAKANPFLLVLAGYDKDLLKEYVNLTSSLFGEFFMPLKLPNPYYICDEYVDKDSKMRYFSIGSILHSRSEINASHSIVHPARLIGVKSLERKVLEGAN